ncbi:MAG: hypothetical protein ACQETG_00245 [Thermodesulfobacteriota bacterium]
MKHLSFKIIIICILMPPVLYTATIEGLESYFAARHEKAVNNVYLSDMNSILNGTSTLSDAINESISQYIKDNPWIDLGVKLDVTVATKQGTIVYPPVLQEEEEDGNLRQDTMETARKNFRMLENGLNLETESGIEPISPLSGGVLLFYILVFGSGLYVYYRMALRKTRREEIEKAEELQRLQELENEYARRVDQLDSERRNLSKEYTELQKSLEEQKREAERNEEDMFDEIEQLEKRLSENLSQQETQQDEISRLKEELSELEKLRENMDRQKEKEAERIGKRFKTLYKNVEMYDRALRGIADLPEDMALKAEELIHQLNLDASKVTVKRKVFHKKGRNTVFEVVFSYNGRLYFSKNSANRIHVLAVGTKNTQNSDLAYLDRTAK